MSTKKNNVTRLLSPKAFTKPWTVSPEEWRQAHLLLQEQERERHEGDYDWEDGFGFCPECHEAGVWEPGLRVDALLDGSGWHFMVCFRHRLKWEIGNFLTILLTSKQLEWNTILLSSYQEVGPAWMEHPKGKPTS